MNTTKRNYEALYIVDATLTDDQVQPIIDKYTQLVADQGGEVQGAGRWDKRRLAYEVAGHREGTYILMYFIGEPEVSEELDRVFRISDDVFRHIIVRVEPEHIDLKRLEQAAAEAMAAPAAAEAAVEAEAPAAEEAPAEEVETAPAETAEPTAETAEAPAAEPETAEPEAEQPEASEETPVEETPAPEEPAAEQAAEETGEKEPKPEGE